MEYLEIPQPDQIPKREKEDAMGSYLMMFASIGAGLPLPIINLLAAIIYYFVNKGKSPFVKFHALQSLLSQLPTSLLNAGAVFWTFRIIIKSYTLTNEYWGYLAMVGVANLIYFVFSIIAAVKARKGQMYYLLFFGRVAYSASFKNRDSAEQFINRPPSI